MKKRITITISHGILQQALAMMKQKHYETFSGYLEELIRRAYDNLSEAERGKIDGLMKDQATERENERNVAYLNETPSETSDSPTAEKPVDYHKQEVKKIRGPKKN